jgi:hypothetical protein
MESEKLKALYNEGNLTEVMKQLGQSRDEAKDPAAKASLQGAMDKVSNLQAGGPEALEKFKKDSALKMRLEGKGKEEWGKLKQAGKGMAEIIERDLKRGAIKVNEKIKSALADTKLGQELSRKVQAGLGKAKAVGAKVGRAKTVVTEKAGEMAGKVKESRVGRAGIRAGQEIYKGGAAATKFVKSRVTEEGRKEAYKEKILSRAEAEQQYRRQRAESRVRAAGITQKMNEKEEQIQKLDKTTPAGRDKADQLIKEKNALSEQLNAERNKLAAAKKNYEQAVAAESKAQARVAKGAKPAPTPGLTPADTKELKQAPTPEERKEFGQQAGSISVEVDKEALKEAFAEASEAIKLPSFSAAGPQGLLGDQLLLTRLLKSVDHLSSVMQKQGVSFGRMGTNIERLGKMLHQLQRARTPVARQAVLQSQGLKESDLKRIMQDLLGQGMG